MPIPARPRVGLRQVWWVLALFTLQKLVFLVWLVTSTDRGYLADMFQWDGPRYLEIAREGYHYPAFDAAGKEINSNLAFFPLCPLSSRTRRIRSMPPIPLSEGSSVSHTSMAPSMPSTGSTCASAPISTTRSADAKTWGSMSWGR